MFFKRHTATVKITSKAMRADGYRECDIEIVLEFQKVIEIEHGSIPALQTALFKMRDNKRPVQDFTLRAAYNDALHIIEGYS